MNHVLRVMLITLLLVPGLISCRGHSSPSAAKAITAFSFTNPAATGIIDESARTISVTVPYGTNVTALIATFTATSDRVTVGNIAQLTGTTPNDFSNSVIYTVTAEDGTTAQYSVTVTVALSSAKAIATFSIMNPATTGVIDEPAKSISVSVPYGTNVTALIATFTTTGAEVKVGNTLQVSGTSINDFSTPVTYIVAAADGTSVSYIVTVTVRTITVTHLAGPLVGAGSADGTGPSASFNRPYDVTSDGTNLYIADTDNNTIRKIIITTGEVTTLAGTAGNQGDTDGMGAAARFFLPQGITTDGTNLYVADNGNNSIRKIVIATGEATTLAGGTWGSTDGTGTAASFSHPCGIAREGTNLYVTDSGGTIRKIVIATGEVTTLAGTFGSYPGIFHSRDGTGASANFLSPYGITSDGTNLYVTETNFPTIRKIVIATASVTTLTDSTGAPVIFNYPVGIINDGTNLYVTGTDSAIRKIVIASGTITTFVGGTLGAADGTEAAASFYNPRGITIDGSSLYVADTDNNTIRKIVIASGAVTTLAGPAGGRGSTDGTGASARFFNPQGITTDGTNIYVADTDNNTIRKIVIASGDVTTLAGTAGLSGSTDGTGPAARFYQPVGITGDGANLYVTDYRNHTIRKIVIATGEVTTLAGTAGIRDCTDGTGAAARFNYPVGITSDGTNVYVADYDNHTIRKIVIASGVVTTFAGTANNRGSADGTGAAASFFYPRGISCDGTNLYVADTSNSTIRKIVIATGAVTTLAGTAGSNGLMDGTGTAARFYWPYAITNDGTNLYVADTYNKSVRKIVIATETVTTFAGTAGIVGSTDGAGATACFNYPMGITNNGTNLYVTDTKNNAIRKISF